MSMPIKAFDSLASLSAWFEGPVFRDISDDSLLVEDVVHHVWHRYEWSHGKREIVYRGTFDGELPLIAQVYPPL